jgi:Ca-activated chloride channel family protein
MYMWCLLSAIGIGLLLPTLGSAVSPYEAVQQGNTLYQAGQYQAAGQQYELAGQALPDAAEIHFNQGNTFYKQQDYAKALEHYTQALRTTDRQLEGKVKYNLGNTAYQQALQAMQKPGEATTHLQTAMQYYRDSLEVDPQRQEARYNFELAQRLLQQLQQAEQQQPQPSQSQEQQQQQQNQQPASQQQQDDAPAAPQPEQRQSQSPAQPQEQQGQQPESKQDNAQASQEQRTDPAAAPPPSEAEATRQAAAQELRPEDAERLLDAIRERARAAEHLRQQWRRSQGQGTRVDKDW